MHDCPVSEKLNDWPVGGFFSFLFAVLVGVCVVFDVVLTAFWYRLASILETPSFHLSTFILTTARRSPDHYAHLCSCFLFIHICLYVNIYHITSDIIEGESTSTEGAKNCEGPLQKRQRSLAGSAFIYRYVISYLFIDLLIYLCVICYRIHNDNAMESCYTFNLVDECTDIERR